MANKLMMMMMITAYTRELFNISVSSLEFPLNLLISDPFVFFCT